MKVYDTVICDVDGVLIDVSHSFTAAAIDAVKAATGSDRFGIPEVRQLKGIPGFNDDWHVAVAGAAWATWVPFMPFDQFAAMIEAAGGGLAGLAEIPGIQLTVQMTESIIRLAQEAYGGLDNCNLLYGFVPATIKQSGRFNDELPMPGAVEIHGSIARLGIVSGRNEAEMALAIDTLGWTVAEGRIALAGDPALNKPDPERLLAICSLLGSNNVIYAGDSRDDYDLIQNARRHFSGQIDFACIAVDNPTWNNSDACYSNLQVLMNNIEVYND